jgi:hypothetical protein
MLSSLNEVEHMHCYSRFTLEKVEVTKT